MRWLPHFCVCRRAEDIADCDFSGSGKNVSFRAPLLRLNSLAFQYGVTTASSG
jgi:hypothetical protein